MRISVEHEELRVALVDNQETHSGRVTRPRNPFGDPLDVGRSRLAFQVGGPAHSDGFTRMRWPGRDNWLSRLQPIGCRQAHPFRRDKPADREYRRGDDQSSAESRNDFTRLEWRLHFCIRFVAW